MKRIVVCADGTWQSPKKAHPSNVLRVARAIKPVGSGNDQVVFYDWGVGSDRKNLAGGISGVGIDKNIQDCYRFIVQNYDLGDQLYFFGFSRGAYTVRSLGSLLRNCGILKREHAARIPEAYGLYRKRGVTSHPNATGSVAFRRRYAVANKSPIRFIGVWDTVGALGIPIPFLGTLGDEKFLFHDTEPSSIVETARHALSIDENREDFEPAMWDADKPGLDLRQVWFAGVHADVGGGYGETGLSDTALNWLLQEAQLAGLEIEIHLTGTLQPDPLDKLHNEWKGFYKLRQRFNRASDKGCLGKVPLNRDSLIHESVKQRWDRESSYRKSKPLSTFLKLHGDAWDTVQVAT